jgi:rare lipoprotein A (peptidoglycan hydrolase)
MNTSAASGRSHAIFDRRRPPFDKFFWASVCCALSAAMLAGCSSNTTSHSYYGYGSSHTAVASWYGPGFEGHRTSSGESYDPEAMTAASPSLPMGSHVRVANPDTGKSVVVRINDRGPFVHGRSLDLSYGAAEEIGLTDKGTTRVQVTPAATSTPAPGSSHVAHADSAAAKPRTVSYASYLPHFVTTRARQRHYHYHSSRRIISNPIGAWLSSALPRL